METDRLREFELLVERVLHLRVWHYGKLPDGETADCAAPAFPGGGDASLPAPPEALLRSVIPGEPRVLTLPDGSAMWAAAAAEGLVCALGPAVPEKQGAEDFPAGFGTRELTRWAAMLDGVMNFRRCDSCGTEAKSDGAARAMILAHLADSVRRGDLGYRDMMSQANTNRNVMQALGIVTTRSAKETTLAAMETCGRAAVEGGLTQSTVDALMAEYMPRLRATEDPAELAGVSDTILYHLVRLVRRAKGERNFSPGVQAACTYIEEHTREKLTLPVLARAAGYSPDYLSRRFREEVGCSVGEYCLSAQMSRIMLLLTTTAIPVAELADMFSFCSPSHFTEVFSKRIGCTPTQFRARYTHLI